MRTMIVVGALVVAGMVPAAAQAQEFTDDEIARMDAAAQEMEAAGIDGNDLAEAQLAADILELHGITEISATAVPPPVMRVKRQGGVDTNLLDASCDQYEEMDIRYAMIQNILTGGGLAYGGAAVWVSGFSHMAQFVPAFRTAAIVQGSLAYIVSSQREMLAADAASLGC